MPSPFYYKNSSDDWHFVQVVTSNIISIDAINPSDFDRISAGIDFINMHKLAITCQLKVLTLY